MVERNVKVIVQSNSTNENSARPLEEITPDKRNPTVAAEGTDLLTVNQSQTLEPKAKIGNMGGANKKQD